jgi:hypothetical protein
MTPQHRLTAPTCVTLLPASPVAVGFEFPTVVGRRYVIERKATLNDPQWIETEVRTGTGGMLQFTRPVTAGSAFFRLRVSSGAAPCVYRRGDQ